MDEPLQEPIVAVVVTYNSARVVGDLLDSIPAAADGLPVEVVVVDNSSTDATVELLRGRGDCTLVEAPNDGYSAGINRGVAAARGHGPILVLNPDVRLAPGSIRRMLEALEAHPRVGIVGPRVLHDDGRLAPSMRREPTLLRNLGLGKTGRALLEEYVTDPSAYDVGQVCDWVVGAIMLVDRACHEALGGWDESFFLYSEETDFCLRARDAGWLTWYEPTATTTHIEGQSGRNPRTHAMQILNRVRLYRRRNGPLASAAYWALSVLSELSWLARGNRHSKASITALVRPSARPRELGLRSALIPR